ncbi:MAG: DUF4397 domain-containing protein [Pseudomonadota bacterium]
MNTVWKGLILGAAVFAAACDSNDNDTLQPPEPTPTFNLQVVHASSNAPAVNVLIDGTETLSAVDYKDASGEATLLVDSYDIQVDAILPDGSTTPVIPAANPPLNVTFEADINYTVIALGNVGDTGDTALQAKIVERPLTAVPAGNIRLTAVHGAAGAPAVDVYVTAPGADLTTEVPLNETTPLAFNDDALGPVEVPAGQYQVRITVAGDPAAVAFDSGPLDIGAGADLVAIAVDNTNAGAGTVPGAGIDIPVSVLLVDSNGAIDALDVQTTAEVRVTHAVPDAGLVDVYANGALVAPLEDFDFTQVRGPLALPADDYAFQVAPANSQNFVINAAGDAIALAAGTFYDAAAVGSIADANLGLLTAADDRRRLATAAKLRVIHGSPSAGPVDLYVVDSTITDISNVEPFAEDIPFLFNSTYLELAPGTYNVYITPADSKTIVIPAEGLPLDAAGIYTAIARDPVASSTDFGLILLDDFVSP